MDQKTNQGKRSLRKGIYLLPSLFTLAGLFSGFYSIVASTKGLFILSAIWIFVAMICDGLDGRVARLTQTQSEFGAQLDSISDMVCFGIAPALMVYCWSLSVLGKVGWLLAFWFAVGTALRLARFNAAGEQQDKKYFKGLSSPIAAAFIASFVWSFKNFDFQQGGLAVLMGFILFFIGVLMVSSVPYRSFKDFDLCKNVPFFVVLLLIVVICFIILDPPRALFFYSSLYILIGLGEYLIRFCKSIRGRKKAH